ncbi:MAG: hypothetical protein A2921_03095 [Candidatus Magasanikbacteria bacterium RIFCSPLOWO2_01_FULL_43_20b]|uniref:DUF7674 domain-containing protein n=1 Tax=Candidatus Magasanikbacteria bacterium RIFCSPLOWO2_12_FULL_43_12 TaxID=1798692 RepID=A0A1F6MWD5_9BACT|nr:MAG: hypothetical protein A3C74_04430 [Candidatus Magasanikbacteria bacterium RIFCSPHIGHO2_02_FULL_44_13]OGH71877.1 MAG: hypothetical protein A3I93_01970 [Candidatus Magasanikbacteria bacterium RIFCSPLOWO2_02_FULL_43_22]OGH72850.1 MAG: hypothetical protein A2921_03095 [Candidatus Magasanikbacteria bacterium RIFCSPLOWO2_01_FULL_43_20b]OGH75743.1 MAG: hypothetical protein A3G00_03300 [Candidatus Magasanikbacteria bacterium RIFCSPLOWO2_12_FULL_43_12]
MTKITHDNAVQELLNRVPELKSYHQFDEFELSEPTIVFDKFGDFLLGKIKSESQGDRVIKKSFDLINEMQDSEDPNVQNLPQVGVFEVLVGSKKGLEVGEKLLNQNGREWLNKIKQDFNSQ